MQHPTYTLQIPSAGRDGSVNIHCQEIEGDPYPSAALTVEIAKGDFRGVNPRVWDSATNLDEFIGQLEQLDRTRKGAATLQAISPDEFDLTIRSMDSLGHLIVEARVGRLQLVGNRPTTVVDKATVSFELDPSLLGETLESFRGIGARVI